MYMSLRCDTADHLRQDINTAFGIAGWSAVGSLTNGIVYSLVSPDLIGAHCRVQDTGYTVNGYGCIDIQFMSTDETVQGYTHHLAYGIYSGYQIIAGICQMFISQPFHAANSGLAGKLNNFVAGGIPAIVFSASGECGAEMVSAPSDRWWSSGNETDGEQSFRSSLYCTGHYSVYYNGALHVSGGGESVFSLPLRLVALAPTDEVPDSYFGTTDPILQYGSGLPLNIDAFMAYQGHIIGQMWDAFIRTDQPALETTIISVEDFDTITHWRSFNYGSTTGYGGRITGGGTHYGTLFLVEQFPDYPASGGEASNYAY